MMITILKKRADALQHYPVTDGSSQKIGQFLQGKQAYAVLCYLVINYPSQKTKTKNKNRTVFRMESRLP